MTSTRKLDQQAPPSALRLIGLYEFGKGLLLLATAWGVHRLLDPHVAQAVLHWSATLTDRFARDITTRSLASLVSIEGTTGGELVVLVTIAYALLHLAEGVGLWLRRRWAEWLTVVSGGALIPIEVWRLVTTPRHRSLWVVAVLIGNVLLVAYLIAQLRRRRRA